MTGPSGCPLLALLCLALPASVDAQETEQPPSRVTLHGVVYDALTGAAVAGAAVYLSGEGYGVLSDSAGVFRFADVPLGPQLVAASQFGYEETAAPISVGEADLFVEVALAPQPILLDGVTAVVDNITTMESRLASRRRSTPLQALAFDQERLLRSTSATALQFLQMEARHRAHPCPGGAGIDGLGVPAEVMDVARSGLAGSMSTRCIIRRGRYMSPRVYIDEIPAIGGLDELDSYPTAQLYALEVYSEGAEIRAYTYNFMQRMAHQPMPLIPISPWP